MNGLVGGFEGFNRDECLIDAELSGDPFSEFLGGRVCILGVQGVHRAVEHAAFDTPAVLECIVPLGPLGHLRSMGQVVRVFVVGAAVDNLGGVLVAVQVGHQVLGLVRVRERLDLRGVRVVGPEQLGYVRTFKPCRGFGQFWVGLGPRIPSEMLARSRQVPQRVLVFRVGQVVGLLVSDLLRVRAGGVVCGPLEDIIDLGTLIAPVLLIERPQERIGTR
ncbi:Uncharacterised protein [Mycobacteroides abscessus]|nr:Uncharacterised protein [Mycobacteroides abscessus]